jgi:hypothetical protein
VKAETKKKFAFNLVSQFQVGPSVVRVIYVPNSSFSESQKSSGELKPDESHNFE